MRGRRRNHNTLTLPTRKPVREGVKSLVSLPYTDTFKHCGQFAPRWFRAAGLRCRLGKLRANAEMRRQAGEWLLENKAQFARTVPAKHAFLRPAKLLAKQSRRPRRNTGR